MRLDSLLEYVGQQYPDRAGVALIEGLPPLARIALTARTARRTLSHVTFRIESAKLIVESAISSAEKAASGEEFSPEENVSESRDLDVVHACQLEKSEGDSTAGAAASVARYPLRCVTFHSDLVYGECAFSTSLALQRVVQLNGRHRCLEKDEIHAAVVAELGAADADLDRMIVYAESSGEKWSDPRLMERWAGNQVFQKLRGEDNRERWKRIHTETKRAGGCFYSPHIFGPF